MTIEIVQWIIKRDQEAAFEAAFSSAAELLARADGYIGYSLSRCVENRSKYLLRVEWRNMEAHTEQFRGSALYQEYRALIKPYYEEGAILEHYENVLPS